MAQRRPGFWQGWRYEPARLYALIAAGITVGVAFGLDVTEAQQNAILALAALVVGAGEATRRKVVPEQKLDDAKPVSNAEVRKALGK